MKTVRIFVIVVLLSLIFSSQSHAIVDPLSKTNNKVGIHILFPEELSEAARLVNSRGGDWGYVTIPIQVADRDIEKWQKFMDDCTKNHLIPIIRLSTEAHYKETDVWRQPTQFDILDFANFLNSLSWPTKNRYVILFNEVNRFDEWEGKTPDPAYYADLVEFSVDAFKRRNSDFFIILGGMDNAAPNDGVKYMGGFEYLSQMATHNKNAFVKIDGFSSHSYPNPNFAEAPKNTRMSVSTYKYESEFIKEVTGDKKAVFITETGWNSDAVPGSVIAEYYTFTFSNIWNASEDRIVAVTPFLLRSQGGPFDKFSFYKNGVETLYFKAVQEYPKEKGAPDINPVQQAIAAPLQTVLGVKDFRDKKVEPDSNTFSPIVKSFFKRLFGVGK